MKMRKFAAVLLAIVLLCAAVPNVAFAQSGETMGNAININLNETVSAERYYCYYKFTIDRPGYIQLKVDHSYNGGEFFCVVFQSKTLDAMEYQWDKFYNLHARKTAETTTGSKMGLKAGTYYLEIHTDSTAEAIDYDLTVMFTAANDWEAEKNDNVATANNIKLNEVKYGHIGEQVGNYDYFKIDIPSDGKYEIVINHDYSNISHDAIGVSVRTYDGTDEKKCGSFFSKGTTEKTKGTFDLSAGTYYIKVEDYARAFFGEYSIVIKKSSATGSKPSHGSSGNSNDAKPAGGNNVVTAAPSSATESETFAQINAEVEKEAGSAEIKFYGDFKYIVINVNIYICGYVGSDEKVEIPSEIDGMPVVGITDNAFAKTSAQEITVPSSVSEFGKNAFGEEDGETRTIVAEEGSPVEAYALSTGMNLKKFSAKDSSKNSSDMKLIVIAMSAVVAVIGAAAVVTLIVLKKRK